MTTVLLNVTPYAQIKSFIHDDPKIISGYDTENVTMISPHIFNKLCLNDMGPSRTQTSRLKFLTAKIRVP